MTNNPGSSIFFASDKNIFDALMQKKISHSKLLDFLRQRGIVVSNKAEREDIARYISRTFIDYYDFQQVSSFLEGGEKKEKVTSSVVEAEVSKAEVISACQEFKELAHKVGENCRISQEGNVTKLTVDYEEVDFSKTELKQRTTKTCEIEIQSTSTGLSIRQPANPKASAIAKEIVHKISASKDSTLELEVVSLQYFSEPEARSFFFAQLIRSIDGYRLDDVKAVSINHRRPDNNTLEVEESDLELEEREELERDATGYISKAVLTGTGVLESSEFTQLHQKGFFISKIVWTVINRDTTNSQKVEFEALFRDPVLCTGFAYACKGFFERKEDGNFNITRKSFDKLEETSMIALVEKAARFSYREVTQKYSRS